MMKRGGAVLITNIPSPYRVLQFDEIARTLGKEFTVIYYRSKVNYREWNISEIHHQHLFLKRNFFSKRNIHFQIIPALKRIDPDVVISTGFTITTFLSYLFCKLYKKKFIILTDSWMYSVNQFGFFRKKIRSFLIPKADAFVCIGEKGKKFLINFGAQTEAIFKAPLAIDNVHFFKFFKPYEEKEFDIIFSGQFIERKMPFFVIDVIKEIKRKRTQFKLLLIGSGPLKDKILSQLEDANIEYYYPGFIQQVELPKYYSNAKVLLFPTMDDPWGLVANEACAVGTPVITCENAGVANDLVLHNFNGYVLPLEVNIWVQYLEMLLSNMELYKKFAHNSLDRVQSYSISNASVGIVNSVNSLLDK